MLPSGELAAAAHPQVMQDEKRERFAYVRGAGDVRLVYLVAGNAYFGPILKAPIDFGSAPDRDHALGALFENAGERRAQLVADVAKQLGQPGVARMLIDGASVDDPSWDDAFAKLPEANAAEVKSGLASQLEHGKPTSGLKRAVKLVPLREPARVPVLAARVRELADPVREPRASAVMLRALAALDKAQAGTVGCEVLGKKPLDVTNAKGTPTEIDPPGRELLVEAALLAIANAGAAPSARTSPRRSATTSARLRSVATMPVRSRAASPRSKTSRCARASSSRRRSPRTSRARLPTSSSRTAERVRSSSPSPRWRWRGRCRRRSRTRTPDAAIP